MLHQIERYLPIKLWCTTIDTSKRHKPDCELSSELLLISVRPTLGTWDWSRSLASFNGIRRTDTRIAVTPNRIPKSSPNKTEKSIESNPAAEPQRAMAAAAVSVPDQIRQLDGARKLVLENVSYYKDVVRGTLPLIGANSAVEIRRWGADFLAEAFATPAVPNGEKETMQPYVLVTLESLLEDKNQDPYVLRSVIQTAASIYPLALRWM